MTEAFLSREGTKVTPMSCKIVQVLRYITETVRSTPYTFWAKRGRGGGTVQLLYKDYGTLVLGVPHVTVSFSYLLLRNFHVKKQYTLPKYS